MTLFPAPLKHMDGLGALILGPTKEIVYQIFEVLKTLGKFHDISAGCLVGGRPFEMEQKSISRMAILCATPGRLLQHLEETADFEWGNLRMFGGRLDVFFEYILRQIR